MSDLNIENLISESIDNAVKNITDKPTLSLGTYIDDILFLVFGGFHQNMEKRRIAFNQDLKEFENDVKSEVYQIPTEKQIEPQTGLILSTLDAAKYKVEERELRKMFAKLISSSMNSDSSDYVHPSFATTIKEMSALDAENIALFQKRSEYPIVNYKIIQDNNLAYHYVAENVFLSNPNINNSSKQSASISFLVKLGLLQVTYYSSFYNASEYEIFKNTKIYQDAQAELQTFKQFTDDQLNQLSEEQKNLIEQHKNSILDIEKGVVYLTEYGKDFIKVCL